MKLCVIDLETDFSFVEKLGKSKAVSDYGDCFNSSNRVVLAGLMCQRTGKYVSFDFRKPGRLDKFKAAVAKFDGIIGHNVKYEYLWLKKMGVELDGKKLYDTMLLEYIRLQGQHKTLGLGLDVVAPRHGGSRKLDIVRGFWDAGVTTSDIPVSILSQYLYEDCLNTKIVFDSLMKCKEIRAQAQFCKFYMDLLTGVCEMEYAGAKFNDELRHDVADDIDAMLTQAAAELTSVVADLTKGHELNKGKPLNLDSPAQLMPIMYSLRLKDDKELKAEWKVYVSRFRPYKKGADDELQGMIKRCFDKLPYGAGIKPSTSWMVNKKWATVSGFSTSSAVIEALLEADLNKKQTRLVNALTAYSKASTWKSSNLAGVINGVKSDGFIHGKFNMAVTATRRFSSSEPNMQNWPREGTNPLKKLVKSRYKGGHVINADHKQLEFRVAGLLSGDEVLNADVASGFDIHAHSASMALGEKWEKASKEDKKELRNLAKRTTFRFQYGAMPKNKIEKAIYDAFYGKYRKLAQWQERLEYHIIRDQKYTCPFTGSTFLFEGATASNKAMWITKAKNYPVQYLAAVINACSAIGLREALAKFDERCLWILTVHDSNVIDVPAEQLDEAVRIIRDTMQNINPVFSRYFKKDLDILLAVDVQYGPNWYQQEEYTNDRIDECSRAA